MIDSAQITAWCVGIAGIIAAVAGLVKIIANRPRMPVAEELLEQLDEMRDDVLALARWAHRQVAIAAAAGIDLEEPPSVLRSVGHRDGERRHDDDSHGWRSSVRAQTGPQRAIRPDEVLRRLDPETQPNRRARPTPPPVRG